MTRNGCKTTIVSTHLGESVFPFFAILHVGISKIPCLKISKHMSWLKNISYSTSQIQITLPIMVLLDLLMSLINVEAGINVEGGHFLNMEG